MFLGFGAHQKGYKCYNPNTRKFFTTMDVMFLENEYFFSKRNQIQGENTSELDYLPNLNFLIQPENQLDSAEKQLGSADNQLGSAENHGHSAEPTSHLDSAQVNFNFDSAEPTSSPKTTEPTSQQLGDPNNNRYETGPVFESSAGCSSPVQSTVFGHDQDGEEDRVIQSEVPQ